MKELKTYKIKNKNFFIILLIIFSLFIFTLSNEETNQNSQDNVNKEIIQTNDNNTVINTEKLQSSNNTSTNNENNQNEEIKNVTITQEEVIKNNTTQEIIKNNTTTDDVPANEITIQETNENTQPTQEHKDIVNNIEKKINQNIENNPTTDILKKYNDFNLTEEVEKKYDDYEEDKPHDYFENVDNIEDHKPIKKSKREIEEEKYNEDWDEKVAKLNAHDLLTFKIPRREYEIFYDVIETVPVNVTVAYYVHDDKSKIDFEVYNNRQKIIYKLKGKNRGFAEFLVREPGRYEFHLSNEKVKI